MKIHPSLGVVQSCMMACPVPGCLVFPYDNVTDLHDHLIAGDHLFELSNGYTAAQFEAPVERPTGTGSSSSSSPAAPAEVSNRWAKTDGVWMIKTPAGTYHEGETVTVTKASGETAEVILGASHAVKTDRYGKHELFKVGTKATSVEVSYDAALEAHHEVLIDAYAAPAKASPVTEPGMYRTPDGELYKVQAAKGHGGLYAKHLVELAEPVVMKTKTKTHDFEYEQGCIRKLTAEMRLTLDEAKAWGRETGTCCNCGAELTKAESIAAGIGPICAGGF